MSATQKERKLKRYRKTGIEVDELPDTSTPLPDGQPAIDGRRWVSCSVQSLDQFRSSPPPPGRPTPYSSVLKFTPTRGRFQERILRKDATFLEDLNIKFELILIFSHYFDTILKEVPEVTAASHAQYSVRN